MTAVAGCIHGGGGDSDTIDIGLSVSLSGNFGISGQRLHDGYVLWEEHINEDGGILGNEVELHIEDDESAAENAVSIANRLVEQENVDMFFGPYSSPITAAMMPVCEQRQIPLIATIASDPTLFDGSNEWVFQAFPDSYTDHQYAVEMADEMGAESAALLWETIDFAEVSRNGAVDYCEDAGIQIRDWDVPYGTEDVGTAMTEIVDYNPDIVLGSVYGQTLIAMTREMIDRDYDPDQFSALIITSEDYQNAYGEQINGVMGRAPWTPALVGDIHDRFASDFEDMHDYVPDYHSATAYSGGQVYASAAEDIGSTDPADIRDFLESDTAETLCGTYEVDDNFKQVGYYNRLVQWQDMEQQVIKPDDEMTSDDVIWPKPTWDENA